jgi:hypothetical protein
MRKRLVAALVAGGLVLGLAACKPEITAHVVIVGDSITSTSLNAINDEFTLVARNNPDAGRYLVTPDAIGGIGVRHVPGWDDDEAAYWTAHIDSVEEHASPEAWIIELGTNDCYVGDWQDYDASIDLILARIPQSRPVFWVNLWSRRPADEQCVADVNAALDLAPTRWPNLTIIDAHSTLGGDPANYSDDRHPSEQGKTAYAKLLRTALDDAFGETPEPTTTTEPEPTTTTEPEPTTTTEPEPTTTTSEPEPTTTTEPEPTTTTTEAPPEG